MARRLILLLVFFILFGSARSGNSCEAPPVYINQPANVTCHFDIDVAQERRGVTVYKISNTGKESDVLTCIWIDEFSKPQCKASSGYVFEGIFTQTLVVRIPSATAEHVGTYLCQVVPSEPDQLMPCNFTLTDPSKAAGEEKTDSTENDNTVLIAVLGSIGSLAVVVLLIVGVVVYRRREQRIPEPTQDDTNPPEAAPLVDVMNCPTPPQPIPTAKAEVARDQLTGDSEAEQQNLLRPVTNGDGDERQRPGQNDHAKADVARDQLTGDSEAEQQNLLRPVTNGDGDERQRPGQNDHEKEEIRVVLVGRTGVGKSSLGNRLLGVKEHFKVDCSFSSGTAACGRGTVSRCGQEYLVVDTPGLCDTRVDEMTVCHEIAMSVSFTRPGPHVILIVIKCGRFTKEEYQTYLRLKTLFGGEMLQYTIIVFTNLDSLKPSTCTTPGQKELQDNLAKSPDRLQTVLAEAGQRYFGMDNLATGAPAEKQIEDLFEMITKLYKENDKCFFTNDFFREIENKIKADVEARMDPNSNSPVNDSVISDSFTSQLYNSFTSGTRDAIGSLCTVM